MDCSCIRGNFDCYVDYIDKDTLIYQDLSDWMIEEGYAEPTEYVVSVTPPASFSPISLSFKIGQLNKITATDIGSIKDGVYCFEVESCGINYKRSKAIFPNLGCCVKQAWVTLGIEWKTKIEEIENHLKLASINAEMNNVQTASKELIIAKKLLDNIKCDCNC